MGSKSSKEAHPPKEITAEQPKSAIQSTEVKQTEEELANSRKRKVAESEKPKSDDAASKKQRNADVEQPSKQQQPSPKKETNNKDASGVTAKKGKSKNKNKEIPGQRDIVEMFKKATEKTRDNAAEKAKESIVLPVKDMQEAKAKVDETKTAGKRKVSSSSSPPKRAKASDDLRVVVEATPKEKSGVFSPPSLRPRSPSCSPKSRNRSENETKKVKKKATEKMSMKKSASASAAAAVVVSKKATVEKKSVDEAVAVVATRAKGKKKIDGEPAAKKNEPKQQKKEEDIKKPTKSLSASERMTKRGNSVPSNGNNTNGSDVVSATTVSKATNVVSKATTTIATIATTTTTNNTQKSETEPTMQVPTTTTTTTTTTTKRLSTSSDDSDDYYSKYLTNDANPPKKTWFGKQRPFRAAAQEIVAPTLSPSSVFAPEDKGYVRLLNRPEPRVVKAAELRWEDVADAMVSVDRGSQEAMKKNNEANDGLDYFKLVTQKPVKNITTTTTTTTTTKEEKKNRGKKEQTEGLTRTRTLLQLLRDLHEADASPTNKKRNGKKFTVDVRDAAIRLLRQGALPNEVDADGHTVLSYCTRWADENALQVLKQCLKSGANPNVILGYGGTALDEALDWENTAALVELLNAEGRINARPKSCRDDDDAKQLWDWPKKSILANKRTWLSKEIHPLQPPSDALSVFAEIHGLSHLTQPLLQEWGEEAVEEGDAEAVRMLLAHGLNPNATMKSGTPFICVATDNAKGDKVGFFGTWGRALMKRSGLSEAEITKKNEVAISRRGCLAGEGFMGVVEALLVWGSNPAAVDGTGTFPLNVAVLRRNFDIAYALVGAGAPRTSLFTEVVGGDTELMEE